MSGDPMDGCPGPDDMPLGVVARRVDVSVDLFAEWAQFVFEEVSAHPEANMVVMREEGFAYEDGWESTQVSIEVVSNPSLKRAPDPPDG